MNRLLEILQLLAAPDQLEDDTVAELETELMALFDDVRSHDELSDEDVEQLEQIADAVDGLRALAGQRIEAAEQAAAEAAQAEAERVARLEDLERRVRVEAEVETEPETEPEPEAEAEVTDPEPEDEDEDDPEPEASADEQPADEPELVTAAARRPTPAEVGARTPRRAQARPTARVSNVVARPVGAYGIEGQLRNGTDVGNALLDAHRRLSRGDGPGGRIPVVQLSTSFSAGRTIGRDANEVVNEIRSAAVNPPHMQTLLADGGLCAPLNVWYGLETIATTGRPLRDGAVVTFNADRGGIRFQRPMTLADIGTAGGSPDQAIGAMTAAQDAAGNVTKTYQMIDCGEEVEVEVEAVWRQLRIGNFIARTHQERVNQFTDLTMAAYDRFSEQRLFAKMVAASDALTAPSRYGATRDLLTVLNRTAISYRHSHRMPVEAPLDLVLPAWVGMGVLPDDSTNALQSYAAQFEVTAAQVTSWLAQRNIRVTAWYRDSFTDAIVGGGLVPDYPSSFTALLYHPGAHVLIDNGELDLGVVRDNELNKRNVFETFAEEFWNHAMWGLQSLAIEFNLCENGASAGSLEPVDCGS